VDFEISAITFSWSFFGLQPSQGSPTSIPYQHLIFYCDRIKPGAINSDQRRCQMPKYLFHGSYTQEGYEGLLKEGGAKRREAAEQALGSVGGRLEAFYFAFGEEDFYIIVDLPDNVATTAVSFVGNVSGTFRIKTIPLLTPEEVDQAVKMSVNFRPPGH
jgi:uncharacterized protein with GYD domain